MENIEIPKLVFDSNGAIVVTASPNSSKHDFDFFQGHWQIRNKKLVSRLNNCIEWTEFDSIQDMQTVLQGIGNVDHFHATFDGEPFEGMTVRLFNPKTRLWNIYWADSNVGVFDPPVVGSFDNKIAYFFTKDVFNGQNIVVVFCWDARDENKPIWGQAFSNDNGETWEWNWFMYMTKIKNE